MHTINNQVIRKGIACVLVMTMAGCASPTYPTKQSIAITREKMPELVTIDDGRAYIVDARQNMVDVKDTLNRSEMMLGGGILAGFIAMADGALSNWNTHTVGRLGIFSAALVGVESSLSLKTQQLIINKGITALNCVERNAESAYAPVQQYYGIFQMIKSDKDLLDEKIKAANALATSTNATEQSSRESFIDNNTAYSRKVTAWLSGNSPAATINAGVKVAVNQVIQTTVEQLSSYLPDGSVFSKIGASLPKSSPNRSGDQGSTPSAPTWEIARFGNKEKWVNEMEAAAKSLETDWQEAKRLTLPEFTQIPSFSCDVATVALPLSLYMPAEIVSSTSDTVVTVTISGGQPPYENAKIMVGSGVASIAITPEIIGSVVLLRVSKSVVAGDYSLVVTDSAGAQKIRFFKVVGSQGNFQAKTH